MARRGAAPGQGTATENGEREPVPRAAPGSAGRNSGEDLMRGHPGLTPETAGHMRGPRNRRAKAGAEPGFQAAAGAGSQGCPQESACPLRALRVALYNISCFSPRGPEQEVPAPDDMFFGASVIFRKAGSGFYKRSPPVGSGMPARETGAPAHAARRNVESLP